MMTILVKFFNVFIPILIFDFQAFQDGHSNHTDEESHDTSNHVTSVMKGLCGLVGIYFFFLIERLLTIHTQQKRKKNKVLYIFGLIKRDRHGRDRIVVGFTTTCAINAYHH